MVRKNARWVRAWLLTGCVMMVLMVMLGGATRLTNSGLSMADWSLAGSPPPSTEEEWEKYFSSYRATPEGQIINPHFTLKDFKKIFWLEYIHRFFGRTIGVVFIIPFIFFLVTRSFGPRFMVRLAVLFLLGLGQGLAGWYMVKSGLVKNPHVSHYRLAFHLFNAYVLTAYCFWLYLRVRFENQPASFRLPGLLYLLITLFITQAMYGALTAGLRSGYAYPDWPLMNGRFLPEEALDAEGIAGSLCDNGAMTQFIHRCLAFLLLSLAIYSTFRFAVLYHHDARIQTGTRLLALSVSIQFLLGVLTVLSGMNLSLAVLHQANSFFLLCTLVWLVFFGSRTHPHPG